MRRVLAAAFLLTACSSFGEDVPSPGTTPPTEGGAPTDASVPDSGSPDSGPPDCVALAKEPSVAFCSTFDEPGSDASPFGWTELLRPDESTTAVEIAPNAGPTGTNALRFRRSIDGVLGTRLLMLRRGGFRPPGTYARLALDFDVRIESMAYEYALLGTFLLYGPSNAFAVHGVSVYGAGAFLDADTPPQKVNVPAAAAWHHVSIVLARVAGLVHAYERTVTIDSTVVDAQVVDFRPFDGVDVRIGMSGTAPSERAGSVLYDNIVVRRADAP